MSLLAIPEEKRNKIMADINDEIFLDFRHTEKPFIETNGGEYEHDCETCGYTKIAEYGIQIENLSFTLTPEAAVELCKKLKKHLQSNGRNV